jgi:hypothetical protein
MKPIFFLIFLATLIGCNRDPYENYSQEERFKIWKEMHTEALKMHMCNELRHAVENFQDKNQPFMTYENYFKFAKSMLRSVRLYNQAPKFKNEEELINALPMIPPDELNCEKHVTNWKEVKSYLTFE